MITCLKIIRLRFLLNRAKISTDKAGRLILLKSQNEKLFTALKEIHFFDFQTTNNGTIIGYSQIIAYLYCGGYQAYQNGFTSSKDTIEVHHIDGNVKNNDPSNLVYLSRQDHQYISNCTYTPFYGKVKYAASTPFNRRGRTITNKHHYLCNILKATVDAISTRHTGKKSALTFSRILMSLPKRLWREAINFYQPPAWLTKSVKDSIDASLFPHLYTHQISTPFSSVNYDFSYPSSILAS